MTRPRAASIAAISILAMASSSARHRLMATAASLRATPGPSVVPPDDFVEAVGDNDNDNDYGDDYGDGDERPDFDAGPSLPLHRTSSDGEAPRTKSLGGDGEEEPPLAKSPTVRLASSRPRGGAGTGNNVGTPTIPLIGIGVGNIPHNRVPYVLALALDAKRGGKSSSSGGGGGGGGGEMDGEMNYRLVDTSHADSALEALVGRSLGRISAAQVGADVDIDDDVYHVMIKVWHTHLGYERTMMSVRDSLSDILPGDVAGGGRSSTAAGGGGTATTPDVRVHAILRYPRCYDELFESSAYLNSPNFPTKYANCAEEEYALDQSVKDASDGVSPLSDKDGAWKRSYRALEELYHRGVLESIGVGDFGPSDLSRLFEIAMVGPHVYQGTLRTLLTQEKLVEDLVRHGVHYQCHDVVSSVLRGREGAPIAYSKLERIGARHGGLMDGVNSGGGKSDDAGGGANEDVYGYSPIQVVLGYLIHHRGVGVVPGTTDVSHLAENSPSSLGNMRRFSPREALDIEMALLALVNGEDVASDAGNGNNMMGGSAKGAEKVITAAGSIQDASGDGEDDSDMEGGVVATFFNTLPHPRSVRIFHVHPDTGEQIQLSHGIPPGRSGRMIVNVDDVLIAYDAHGVAVKKFLVEGSGNESNGVSLDFTVESS